MAEDPARIRRLVAATGRFSADEQGIAEELALERIEKGRLSGYEFEFACQGDRLLGYACFGPIPGTEKSWDLYWIAVDPGQQGTGLGSSILARVEAAIRRAGGAMLYADTSSIAAYGPTRGFYLARGFGVTAELPDFYRPGDGKVIFSKRL